MKRSFLLPLFLLAGCTSVPKFPEADVENFHYVRKDPLGGTEIKAAKIENGMDAVTVLDAIWTTTYPQFAISASVSKYVQKKEKK
jgi:hypothetical protein